MDLKLGYKQTEVGVIPEEWEEKKLPDVCWFQEGPGLRQWQFTTRGMKVINVTNLERGVLNLDSTDRYISLSEFGSMYQHFAIDVDDIVMASSGNSYSKTAVVREHDLPLMMNTSVIRFKPRSTIDHHFLWVILNSWIFKNQIDLMITGGAQPNFGPYHLKRTYVPLPPLPEQRAIAAALSDVDALLAKLDQLIAKKRDIKQAAMQQLLTGKKRLPGFSGEWEVKQLGKIANINMGQSPDSKNYNQRGIGIPLIQGNADIEHRKSLRRVWTTQITKTCDERDLILTVRAPVGTIGVASEYSCMGRGVCSLKPVDVDAQFLFHAMVFAEKQWKILEQGSTFTSANSAQIAAFGLTVAPTLGEQTAIATVLSDMDTEIAALEAQRDKTRELKQGMMQELLTGRMRLLQSVHEDADRKQKKEAANAGHNWVINEAVVISALAAKFGSGKFPLGRMRYTKLSYLMHRHVEKQAEGYLKKAAGPYNPETRYKGPETIAQKNRYIEAAQSGKLSGFIAARNIDQALDYFNKWYGREVLEWLEQFRYEKNESLELLATVDMASQDLQANGKKITVEAVKEVLRVHPEWQPKLKREIFSDAHIEQAITRCRELFGAE